MKTHKLYKDGSIDKFRNYPVAIIIALAISTLFLFVPVGALGNVFFDIPYYETRGTRNKGISNFFHNIVHFFAEFEKAYFLKLITLALTGLVFLCVIYILKKPMIKVRYPFISFYGNSPLPTKFKIPELKSISITSDPYSLSFVIKHIGLTKTIDVKGVSYIEGTAEKFIIEHTHIEPS